MLVPTSKHIEERELKWLSRQMDAKVEDEAGELPEKERSGLFMFCAYEGLRAVGISNVAARKLVGRLAEVDRLHACRPVVLVNDSSYVHLVDLAGQEHFAKVFCLDAEEFEAVLEHHARESAMAVSINVAVLARRITDARTENGGVA